MVQFGLGWFKMVEDGCKDEFKELKKNLEIL
jgi:hypothetical protein